ncbi:uncharacterized protein N7482_007897 [Penicillium canariense]|uniref:Zn(2)-C6 fungal-type domain-containing protein n=1 Tax=Penicillium canariense TaxID=189055 RepID=A0A9W9LKR0_9EURO|nr:uncharacterized protein N7482_007897 [Penicillium canariense]KAJ5160893.1 hypothetical protein N7482_007897 [Penicillium canariense]
MAYTLKRLATARQLFPNHSREGLEFEGCYHLRSRTKNTKTVGSSWIDNDPDDDYSPDQTPRSKRRMQSDRGDRSRPRPTKRARSHSPRPASQPESNTEDNVTHAWAPATPEDRSLSKWEIFWQPQTERDPKQAYFLRARKETMDSPRKVGIDQIKEPNPQEKGHSLISNGCEACQELHLECSLIADPLDYPCDNCRADRCDCVPDPAPTWKRQCEECKRRRRPRCSFLSGDYDHNQPCQECQQHGFQCIAGPAKYLPFGGRSQAMDTEMPNDQDSIIAKEECKVSQPNASNKFEGSELEGITPAPLAEASSSTMQGIQSAQAQEKHDLDTFPELAVPPSTVLTFGFLSGNPYGTSYRIWTDFPHPLNLIDKAPDDGSLCCHWCNNFAYGIVGLGNRNTEVLDFGGGRLIEVVDGHQGEGKEPSRMCGHCVSERLQIMQCPHDDIAPIPNLVNPQGQFNVTAAFESLAWACAALQEPTSPCYGQPLPQADHPWCSLCREPAFWSCETDQATQVGCHKVGQSVNPAGIGCGIVLCDYCAHYVKLFHGDLDQAVEWGKGDPENGTEFRADVNYILKGSEGNYLRQQIYRPT